jgi:hypothetical protein
MKKIFFLLILAALGFGLTTQADQVTRAFNPNAAATYSNHLNFPLRLTGLSINTAASGVDINYALLDAPLTNYVTGGAQLGFHTNGLRIGYTNLISYVTNVTVTNITFTGVPIVTNTFSAVRTFRVATTNTNAYPILLSGTAASNVTTVVAIPAGGIYFRFGLSTTNTATALGGGYTITYDSPF